MSDSMFEAENKAYHALPIELQRVCLVVHDGAIVYPTEVLAVFVKHRNNVATYKEAIKLTIDAVPLMIDRRFINK